jgi:uncharacterized protein (TIGR03382 family)
MCTFIGSYYDPSPWTEQACSDQLSVPAGCPITFVTGADLVGSDVAMGLLGSDGRTTPIASTATLVDTVSQTFTLPDEDSCDCAPTPIAIPFERFSVAVPSAVAGDVLELDYLGFAGPPFQVQVTAAAPCGPLQWPDVEISLACDRCPAQPSDSNGCGAAGAPTLAIAGLALAMMLRRRRAS